MPTRPAGPCTVPGCPEYRPCPKHGVRPTDHGRASRAPRHAGGQGYTYQWEQRSKAWRRLYPLCAPCLGEGRATSAALVDHIVAHDGDQVLMWDRANWASCCWPCHNRKLRVERNGDAAALDRFRELERAGMNAQGWPPPAIVG